MIDTIALRRKVVDLAISGKLTSQHSQDEDASALCESIEIEIKKLIEEGKIKKRKPLPLIEAGEIPFEIPKNWKWVRLRDICSKIIDGDHNPPAGVTEKTEYLMLSAQNIMDDTLTNMDSVRYLTKEVFLEVNKRTALAIGDVLLTIVATLGRSCVYEGGFNACFQRSVSVIRTLIYPYYLKRVFDSSFIQKYMYENATGAAQIGFYLNKVEKLLIPIPPMDEQIIIAEKLDKIMETIDIVDKYQSAYSSDLEILKSKIINAGIQGKLTEQLPEDGNAEDLYDAIQEEKQKLIKEKKIKKAKALPKITEDEIPFEIPENWKWVRWGEVVNVVSARRVRQSDWRKEGVPFYRAREIAKLAEHGKVENDLFISEELYDNFSKSGIPRQGDLMVSAVGTLGRTYVVEKDDKFYYKDASVLCFENYGGLNPYFLRYLMNSSFMATQIKSNSGGTTVDALTMVRMNVYILPIPPLAEQNKIVECIDSLLAIFK